MNLVVDIGNSTVKTAVFNQGELVDFVQDSDLSLTKFVMIAQKYPLKHGIISSVVDLPEDVNALLNSVGVKFLRFTSDVPVPIQIHYQTPHTLGADRVAAVVAAHEQQPGKDLLVIDAGTCVTYEFIDKQGAYRGGNISPGVQMRLKALHTYTNRLPLVSSEGDVPMYGNTTETAIRAGVMQGLRFEMEGYITHMLRKYPELLVFLTGGDEFSFDTPIKNIIFADKFLVLKGLDRILTYNETL